MSTKPGFKKDEIKEVEFKPSKVDSILFWKWMHSIAVCDYRVTELKVAQNEANVLLLQQQIKAQELSIHNITRLDHARKSVETSKGEYQKIKEEIESMLGFSLSGKAIDEFTYEIKDLPKTN